MVYCQVNKRPMENTEHDGNTPSADGVPGAQLIDKQPNFNNETCDKEDGICSSLGSLDAALVVNDLVETQDAELELHAPHEFDPVVNCLCVPAAYEGNVYLDSRMTF
jgi:hypothetical protein